ncbi:glutamine synthetase [Xylariales sp. AK1849]|nr:glutamine synthetase [Xylariales sp. AK1849]
MASLDSFKTLDAAIDKTPIIDNHAHPLLKPSHLSKYPLLSVATEAHGDALADSRTSLAHIRATKQLAQILGCEATWESVETSIEEQRTKSSDAWVKRCMQGIETLLLDDGLDNGDEAEGYAWHDSFVKSRCKRVVRIEAVATRLLQHHISLAAKDVDIDIDDMFDDILQEFREEIERSIADPEVVGFKSIICYRGGLDIPKMEDVGVAEPKKAFKDIVDASLQKHDSFQRLQHLPLNHLFVHMAARLIQECKTLHKKPIQFHTGLGDNDIILTKSSPSHLQTFISQYPTVPIVILHASYPWTREAGYLAAMYSNVYADIGEVFPFISRDGQEGVLKQILELCPWSKILWSTDGHWFPETYVLATTQIRSVLKTVLGDYLQKGQLDEKQAVQLVQDILFTNSNILYDLRIDATSNTPFLSMLKSSNQRIALGEPRPNTVIIEKLRSLNCKWLRVGWHDYASSARCRLVPMKRVLTILESGKPLNISIAKAGLFLLPTDKLIPEVTATGAYSTCPDWSSLRLGPAAGHASVFLDFKETDGSGSVLCPRTQLRKAIEWSAEHGLEFLLGFELEFVIVERNPDPTHADKYRTMRNDGHAWSMARVLADIGREGSFNTAIDEILDALNDAGILIEQFHPENALGQYEIVLPPLPPMEACDALLHTRQIVEAVAARHNFRMTLHPKPFAMNCGSASHAHMSISSPGGNKPKTYYSFYAGILKHYPAIIAFTYGNPTSYERMVDSAWAGGRWVCWGTQNKEAPLRKCEDSHWELKTMDGLANPYFAMAAILSAGTSGVVNREPLTWGDCEIDPAKLDEEQREKLGVRTMFPKDLKEALKALKEDEDLGKLLGGEFVQRYIDVKNAEMGILNPMSTDERRRWIMDRY